MSNKKKKEETRVNITYNKCFNRFYVEETTTNSLSESDCNYRYVSRNSKYVDLEGLKKYNDYIAVVDTRNAQKSKLNINEDKKEAIISLFDSNISNTILNDGTEIVIKGNMSATEKYNTIEDVKKDYNILYMEDILSSKKSKRETYKFRDDVKHPSLKEIMNNTSIPTTETTEVNDFDAPIDDFFDTKNEAKTCSTKKTSDKCTVTNTNKETKIVPIVEGKTPVIYFDGTLAQNLAVFYSFYKIEEGKHYIPTENRYFIYYPETKSYDETPYLLYETKDFEVINVMGYLNSIKNEISVSTYGERIFDYIISWFQFEMSDKSMIATLLTSTKPFTILLDNKKIEGYNKLLENPARFEEIIKYLENKFGKPLTWALDDNNVLHLTFERNFFID